VRKAKTTFENAAQFTFEHRSPAILSRPAKQRQIMESSLEIFGNCHRTV